jgi:hypothetical protein
MDARTVKTGLLALVTLLATALAGAAFATWLEYLTRPFDRDRGGALHADAAAGLATVSRARSPIKGHAYRASFIAMVALLATAVMGAAYTMWFEDFKADAQVASGTIDATLVCESVTAPAKAEAEDGPDGTHAYNIEVSGLEAGQTIECDLKITNNGTTPWHLEEQALKVLLPANATYAATCEGHPGDCVAGGQWPEPEAGNPKPLYASIEDLQGCQVHEGASLDATLFVGVNEEADPETTYNIELTFKVHQWNESEWDGCGDRRTAIPAGAGRAS